MHGNAGAGTRGIHFFIGFSFDSDIGNVKSRQFRKPAANGDEPVREPGTLADDDGVDIDGFAAGFCKFGHRLLEKTGGIGSAPFFIRIGKMRTDVAERGRAQKRVDDGMYQDIGVGMALEPGFAGESDTAENKTPAFLETVGIISDADSQRYGHRFTPS